MAKVYYEQDADLSLIQAKKVAVIGYGSQGHAHALNLKDSGVDVRIGLPAASASRAKAEKDGLRVVDPAQATREADVVMILTPGTGQAELYGESIAPNLKPGATLMFGHGFHIRFGTIVPPAGVDVSMIAPKSPGHRVRELYKEGAARRRSSLCTRTRAAGRVTSRSHTRRASASRARASSRRRSPKRPRRISSASRPSCAAA